MDEEVVQPFKKFYKEEVVEDEEIVREVAEVAYAPLRDQFHMLFQDPDTKEPCPELIISIMVKIYRAIFNRLEKERETHKSFEINVADEFTIGFDCGEENEDDEKNGNFMVSIKHLYKPDSVDEDEDNLEKTCIECCVRWMDKNVKKNPEIIRSIAVDATKLLSDIDVALASSDAIFPFFCTVYRTLVKTLILKKAEADDYEYEINFASCFNIIIQEKENGTNAVNFRPTIMDKLGLKSDVTASSQYE